MELKKISKKELKEILKVHKNTCYYWKNNPESGLFKMIDNKEVVGLLSCRNKKNCLYINMIETFVKHKGYGKCAIDIVKSKTNKDIKGIPVTEAESFWLNQGAIFDKSIYFTIKNK